MHHETRHPHQGGSRYEGGEHHGKHHGEHHGQERGHHGPRHRGGGEDSGERGHGPFGGGFGGFRGRARRGEARYVLLDALRDGPKHGYEIIKALEEKSGGQYAPSPGTVYPTMQYLEDQGLVRADQGAERRVYHLTEAGKAELEAHAADLADFWERFGSSASQEANQPEIAFLRDALDDLTRTVRHGLHSKQKAETLGQIRQAIEHCQNAVRDIIAKSNSSQTTGETTL